LVTGGTGSFGQEFIKVLLREHRPKKLIIFSRDELKQHEMQTHGFNQPALRYFIGDVRDVDRLRRAMQGVDIVVHAAALKQVPSCEYNPFEAVRTNVLGAQNVIEAAIDCRVKKVMALSTDKAVNPVNLYGATKLCAEKMFIQSNSYRVKGVPKFSCVRYGNVLASRGSVITLFRKQQREQGVITITDPAMTRFWVTLTQGVWFVIRAIERMEGGEIFVPKLPSMRVVDVSRTLAPSCKVRYIGVRPGEKLHESLISEDEVRHTVEREGMYVIRPEFPWWRRQQPSKRKALPSGFRYCSDTNTWWLTGPDLKRMTGELSAEPNGRE